MTQSIIEYKATLMPQLDTVTFFSQFFWLSLSFLTFYLAMYKYFLPKLSRILKIRQKKMSVTSQLTHSDSVTQLGETLVSKALSLSRTTLHNNFQRTVTWVHQVAPKQPQYQKTAASYIQSIGEISLSQNLAIHQPAPQLPQKVLASLVVESLKKIKV